MLSLAHTCFRLTSNYQHRRIRFVSSLKLPWKALKSEVAKGVVWRGWKSLTRSPFLKENCSLLHIEGLWGARGQISRNARWLRSSGRWDVCCKILIFAVLQAICESFGEVCLFARALARCFRPTSGEPHVVFLGTRHLRGWRRSWTMQDRQRIDPARVYIRSFIRVHFLLCPERG